jgi:hypothetical protein
MHDDRELDARVVKALETPPVVAIPAGFAARVTQVGRAQNPVRTAESAEPRFGNWAARGALAVLIVAMLLFAPWAVGKSMVATTVEYALALEFVGLAIWMSLRPGSAQ